MQVLEQKKTRYSKHGKILTPISNSEFIEGMSNGHFVADRHRSYAVLLYYTAIRRAEGLRCVPEQFTFKKNKIIFDVLVRLKHGIQTPPLTIPRNLPFVDELEKAIRDTAKGKRIWNFCAKTAYNIIDRAFGFYPHFFRLSRVTNFFSEGWTIAQVHSWTGLTLKALDSYLGLVSVNQMGMSLK